MLCKAGVAGNPHFTMVFGIPVSSHEDLVAFLSLCLQPLPHTSMESKKD